MSVFQLFFHKEEKIFIKKILFTKNPKFVQFFKTEAKTKNRNYNWNPENRL